VLIITVSFQVFKDCVIRRSVLWCLLALTSISASGAEFPREVAQALRAAGIAPSHASALVIEADSGKARLAVNEKQPMNPASVMKLVTTYAGLELLGPAYRWQTEVFLDGARRGETLDGNVVLRGHGDPKLTYEGFWLLLRQLRARGLRDIRGDVVVDRSFYAPAENGRIDDEAFRPYNVPPDALLLNFRSVRFTFLPDPQSSSVRVVTEPTLPDLEIVNALTLSDGACPEGRAFRDIIGASFVASPKPRASFTGRYPAACAEHEMNAALYAPEEYLASVLRQLWTEMGGSWTGGVREGLAPAGAAPLYVHESPPLAEIVRDINKFSNNVMARQLFLTLAGELGGAPARPENAARSIRDWLQKKGIAAPELVLENGSGLSRSERISAATLASLLQAAWRSPVMPELLASMPVIAIDGTMRRRLRGEPLAGNGHIKTGLLADARSVAGFVRDARGNRHIVVMIVNDPRAPQAQAALDALLRWTYETSATAPARPTSRRPAASPRHP
jgi:D-alanyl-D-alanine carboxypeptidase/D-alanyl-D-alanine-endopeptidase (penicillin-binding protein 4)